MCLLPVILKIFNMKRQGRKGSDIINDDKLLPQHFLFSLNELWWDSFSDEMLLLLQLIVMLRGEVGPCLFSVPIGSIMERGQLFARGTETQVQAQVCWQTNMMWCISCQKGKKLRTYSCWFEQSRRTGRKCRKLHAAPGEV